MNYKFSKRVFDKVTTGIFYGKQFVGYIHYEQYLQYYWINDIMNGTCNDLYGTFDTAYSELKYKVRNSW